MITAFYHGRAVGGNINLVFAAAAAFFFRHRVEVGGGRLVCSRGEDS